MFVGKKSRRFAPGQFLWLKQDGPVGKLSPVRYIAPSGVGFLHKVKESTGKIVIVNDGSLLTKDQINLIKVEEILKS
jgi:hypothetical protein